MNKNSSAWVGFLHFIISAAFLFLFIATLPLINLALDNDFFGFFFTTFWQDVRLFFVATFLAVCLTSWFTNHRCMDPKKVLAISTFWFVGLQILILGLLLFGNSTSHYGLTNQDDFFTQIPLSIMMVIEFYILSRILLKNKGASLNPK